MLDHEAFRIDLALCFLYVDFYQWDYGICEGLILEAIMITSRIVSTIGTVLLADTITNFVERQPSILMLVISFLLMISITLIVESLHQYIDYQIN